MVQSAAGRPHRQESATPSRRSPLDPGEPRSMDALDLVDPDEWNAEHDRRALERAKRRARRRELRARPGRPLLATGWGRALATAVALLAAATGLGLVLLWPGDVRPATRGQALGGPTVEAVATAARTVRCD